jgi:hypothetical protein
MTVTDISSVLLGRFFARCVSAVSGGRGRIQVRVVIAVFFLETHVVLTVIHRAVILCLVKIGAIRCFIKKFLANGVPRGTTGVSC